MTAPQLGLPDDAAYRAEIDRLRRLAMRDELTGLANRRAFLERLGDEIARSRRHGGSFSLVLLDLDGLKDLNDTFGHQAGDAALRTFGRALAEAIRTEDLVARIGGDEFAVIGVHGDPERAAAFARRISAVAGGVISHVEGHARQVRLTAAWGLATWSPEIADAETLFARAESALITNKNSAPGAPAAEGDLFRPRGRRALGEELRLLLGMARSVSSARELQELGRAAAEQAAALIGARMASVALRGADNRTGYVERWVDGSWLPDEWWYADGEGLIGRVMLSAQPYITNNVTADPMADQMAVSRLGVVNSMLLPLRDVSGRALGVLSLTDKRDTRGFGDADVELGMAFADLVAAAIANVRAREEAETSHAYVRSLMEQANDAIYIVDPVTRRIIDVNGAAEALSGYRRAELLAMSAPDLRPPDLRGEPGTTDLALEHEGLVTLPRGHLRKDGAVIPVEVSLRRVRTPRGEVIVNIVRDVRQRVEAEAALRRHNHELQARNDIAALLAASTGDASAMEQVLKIVCTTLNLDGAALGQVDHQSGELQVTAEYQIPEPLRAHLHARRYKLHEGNIGKALAGQLIVINETAADRSDILAVTRQAGVRSFVALPMTAHGATMGVLAAGSFQPNRFAGDVVEFLRAVANQTAIWLEHHRLMEETRQRERDARLIAEFGELLNGTAGLDRLSRHLTDRLKEALGRTIVLFLRSPESDIWDRVRVASHNGSRRTRVRALVRGIAARPINERWRQRDQTEPIIVVLDDPGLHPETAERLQALGINSLLLAPLHAGGRDFGVIAIGVDSAGQPLSPREVALVGGVARHAAIAVANAFARSDLLNRNRELRLTNAIAGLVGTATESQYLYDQVVQRLRKSLGVLSVVLRLWDAERQVLRFGAAAGVASPSIEWLQEEQTPVEGTVMGLAVHTRRPVLIDDWLAHPLVPFKSPKLSGKMAAVVAPLQVGERVVGVLTVLGQPGRRFRSTDTALISTVAGQLAAGLARFTANQQAHATAVYARALFDDSSDALFVVDPQSGTVLDANEAACQLSGYTRDQLLGMHGDCLRPPGSESTASPVDLARPTGHHSDQDGRRLRRQDGALVPVDVRTSLVAGPAGEVALIAAREIAGTTPARADDAGGLLHSQVENVPSNGIYSSGLDEAWTLRP